MGKGARAYRTRRPRRSGSAAQPRRRHPERPSPPPAPAPIGDRTPDECWKWGQIYYNPADPSIWIEKRAGVGYTVNFARPTAWVLVALITLGPLVVILLMRD